jgi:hypothetical protein
MASAGSCVVRSAKSEIPPTSIFVQDVLDRKACCTAPH